jgi:RNA polymerase sigma-70 factor (ECF subfamily)
MHDEIARLYDRYASGLYRYALMVLADHALAEDAVQQVFSRLLSSRVARRVEVPDHYLRRAVRHECLTLLRHTNSRPTERSDDRPLLETAAGVADPVDQVERLSLEAALRELPVDQREVIALKVYEGLTFKEIAELTGAPLNTVASRYRYALDKLRTALEAKVK